ncbi:hypothetical protein LWI29_024978 [Acer saccharum]|uniref:Uncharacterized protein n=1 Tax=Acer saccharum TaxID=4024 RepID=A0AA39SWH2_ACESA|nr:hypothetical protein LWI29_024978 [Acer saccharum]
MSSSTRRVTRSQTLASLNNNNNNNIPISRNNEDSDKGLSKSKQQDRSGNANSTTHGEDVDEVIEADAEEEDGLLLDELCKGVSRISVNTTTTTTTTSTIAKFAGKHARFMYKYNSDGEEIVEESDDCKHQKESIFIFPLRKKEVMIDDDDD